MAKNGLAARNSGSQKPRKSGYPGYPPFHDSRRNLFGTFRAKTRGTNPGKAAPDCLRIVNAPNAPPLKKRTRQTGMRISSALPMLRTARVFGETRGLPKQTLKRKNEMKQKTA